MLASWMARPSLRRYSDKGRDGRIRTGDPLLPKQVRYQAAPHPGVVSLLSG